MRKVELCAILPVQESLAPKIKDLDLCKDWVSSPCTVALLWEERRQSRGRLTAQRSQVPGMSAVAAGGQLGIGRYPWSSSAVAALNSLQRGDDP